MKPLFTHSKMFQYFRAIPYFICPMISLILFILAIGPDPIGLKVGVIIEEFDYTKCFNNSSLITRIYDEDCYMDNLPCAFVNAINESVAGKV